MRREGGRRAGGQKEDRLRVRVGAPWEDKEVGKSRDGAWAGVTDAEASLKRREPVAT